MSRAEKRERESSHLYDLCQKRVSLNFLDCRRGSRIEFINRPKKDRPLRDPFSPARNSRQAFLLLLSGLGIFPFTFLSRRVVRIMQIVYRVI